MLHDHALSLRRRALVPSALDAGGNGASLRIEDAAVPAAGLREGISGAQSAGHDSLHGRRRDQDDGIVRDLPLSRRQAWTDATNGQARRSRIWRVPELDVFQ